MKNRDLGLEKLLLFVTKTTVELYEHLALLSVYSQLK